MTGLSRPAVSLRVGELLERGLVVERTDAPSTGGRPPCAWSSTPRAGSCSSRRWVPAVPGWRCATWRVWSSRGASS
ncbi:hypothetical protein [Nonomuraea dietziae]|uniref:hypothetical protein n=1 Tax=Nonomuraea dietziae TaxID=65515 RepID=UPI003CD07953